MKIKILSGTICGGERCDKDDIVDATDRDAKFLIAIGKAEKAGNAKPGKAAPPAPAPEK